MFSDHAKSTEYLSQSKQAGLIHLEISNIRCINNAHVPSTNGASNYI